MIDFISDQEDEVFIMANGVPSEIEIIKCTYTFTEYLHHIKHMVKQNKKNG